MEDNDIRIEQADSPDHGVQPQQTPNGDDRLAASVFPFTLK
ncbi:hypothetical protein [Mycobacterium sp. 1423905.2]|nr:hypothetical protein [Mycobacterium sp. 1423905.2]